MSFWRRWAMVVLLSVIAVVMVPGVFGTAVDVAWRLVAFVGFVTALLGVRTLLGPIVVVGSDGLVVQKNWPLRRRIAWHRILGVDVVPGFWNLEVELNSGERVTLPCVEHLDTLYEDVESRRQAIDG